MKRTVWPWLVLFGAALVLGVAAGGAGAADDSPHPSIHNPAPRGAKVAATWLAERGASVEALDQPLTAIPPGVEVVVIAAPTARIIDADEVKALEQFVRNGGTLIYLSPRPTLAQPELNRWLQLHERSSTLPSVQDADLADLGGATVEVTLPRSLLEGTRRLRVSADSVLELKSPQAVPAAGPSLWWQALDRGEIWVAAGADLLENRRLELLDNAQLWANLGARRVAFDELHHRAPPAPRWSVNLWATLAQFVFVSLVFVAARGRRLGAPRPLLRREHRSSLEYVASMGALMRRAGVEGELKLRLGERLRRLMQERLGIALTLPAEEASRQLSVHTGLPLEAWTRLDARLREVDSDFTSVAATAARLEDAIVGRRPA